jgi:hypothetical protein
MRNFHRGAFALGALLFASSLPAAPGDATTSLELKIDPATLTALGFEWFIDGDNNRNATATLSYRKANTSAWKTGMPLFRLQNEQVGTAFRMFRNAGQLDFTAPNAFAGSILDLEPATSYEVRLTLSDPDGVTGQAQQSVTVSTRPEPVPASDGRVFHVYPRGYQGPTQEPAFFGLKEAYFTGSIGGDVYNSYPPRVAPGDVILVHAGLYKDSRYEYGHEAFSGFKECCDTTWDGTYYLTGKGTAERPIVIKAAGDGEVIFDGDGNFTLFNMMGSAFNYFEGITFRNTDIAIQAGIKDIAGAVGLTVKRSKFENIGIGIHTDWAGSGGFYIADNVFTGKLGETLVTINRPWPGQSQEEWRQASLAHSLMAVRIYGSGNVVAYNKVRNFHDGVDFAVYGLPERDRWPVSNDIYNNDISNVHDDCVEADGATLNIRVLRNKCINAAGSVISGQPIYGGPLYVIRNVAWNVPGNFAAIKFADIAGMLVYNNTFAMAVRPGTSSNVHFRNNLILAQMPQDPAFALATFSNYSSSDYNGFMAGAQAPAPFVWKSPDFSVPAVYDAKALVERKYPTLAEYTAGTRQDQHSRMVTFAVFATLKARDPNAPLTQVFDPEPLDFSLARRSAAVDAGVALPGVTDDFSGKAPDLGALEFGKPTPHYGPR